MYSAGDFNGLRACSSQKNKYQSPILTGIVFVLKNITRYIAALVKKIVKDRRGRLTMNVMGRLSKGESFGVRISLIKCVFIGIVECSE